MNHPISHHFTDLFVTCFWVGKSPVAPGTMGSIFSIIPFWLIYNHAPADTYPILLWGILLMVFCLSVPLIGRYEARSDRKDPKEVVVDEFIGQWIALAFIPQGLGNVQFLLMGAGFALFRLFDIWKPWPIRPLQSIKGGFGVIIDDVVAGAVAALLLTFIANLV